MKAVPQQPVDDANIAFNSVGYTSPPIKPGGPRWLTFLKTIGPGLITGASDDDPSGIGTYSLAGASFGYTMLWLAPFTYPLMAGVQCICAKIGLVSGCGIAGVLRKHYPRALLYPVILALILANTINAGADLAAIAAGINLLCPRIPILWLILPVGLSILALQIWGSYRLIARIFKWLALAILAYVGAAFFARPDWSEVLRGTLVPTIVFDRAYLMMLVAILGTTISPYLFFWQANQEVEEKAATARQRLWRRKTTNAELEYAFWDVNLGMFLSNLVMFFIILTTASTLHRAGMTNIETASDAAEALRPLAGDGAFIFMALGLIGTGVLTVPILTGSAAYAVAEAVGWKCGLDKQPGKAKEFYLVMCACTVVALAMNFLGVSPVHALFWTAVINGFLSPPLLVIIMLIANNRQIMGNRTNSLLLNVLGGLATILMFAAALGLLITGGG